jgi:hypothetical protein
VTVKDPWGIVITALAGIWLSWSTKYIRKLAGNIALWYDLEWPKVVFWWHTPRIEPSEQPNTAVDPTETDPLLEHSSGDSTQQDVRTLPKIYKETSGIRDLFYEVVRGRNMTWGNKLRLLLFTTVVVIFASAIIDTS